MNREEWLINATSALGVMIAEQGKTLPEVRVSVGFPKTGGKGNNVIGQCWSGSCSEDKRPQIFIHPTLTESTRVLDVLLHELVHATVGTECGHKGAFKHLATALGLEGKMTATVAGDDLKAQLVALVEVIGEYPHAKLDPTTGGKKQTTRMIKCECDYCGYVVRTSRKWIDEAGAPVCPCQIEGLLRGFEWEAMTVHIQEEGEE